VRRSANWLVARKQSVKRARLERGSFSVMECSVFSVQYSVISNQYPEFCDSISRSITVWIPNTELGHVARLDVMLLILILILISC